MKRSLKSSEELASMSGWPNACITGSDVDNVFKVVDVAFGVLASVVVDGDP